jgi:molybdate transport system substrate-binding protein
MAQLLSIVAACRTIAAINIHSYIAVKSTMKLAYLLFAIPAMLIVSRPICADTIYVAVATNFSQPMKQIVEKFNQQTGHTVELSFASSGKIYAQIKHGAPFSAIFSADQEKPLLLEQEGLSVAGSRFTYAMGALVLWSRQENYLDQKGQILTNGKFNKLALANPKLAPYGQAALQVLQNLNLQEKLNTRLVKGESVAQVFQYLVSGNAELGFVALSQTIKLADGSKGSSWVVPTELYQPIRQDAVLLKGKTYSPANEQLMAFMHSEEALRIIRDFGYLSESL